MTGNGVVSGQNTEFYRLSGPHTGQSGTAGTGYGSADLPSL